MAFVTKSEKKRHFKVQKDIQERSQNVNVIYEKENHKGKFISKEGSKASPVKTFFKTTYCKGVDPATGPVRLLTWTLV